MLATAVVARAYRESAPARRARSPAPAVDSAREARGYRAPLETRRGRGDTRRARSRALAPVQIRWTASRRRATRRRQRLRLGAPPRLGPARRETRGLRLPPRRRRS